MRSFFSSLGKTNVQRAVLTTIVAAGTGACASPPAPKATEPSRESLLPNRSRCLKLYETSAGFQIGEGAEPNFQNDSTYLAESFRDSPGVPVPRLEKYAVAGQPLMRWRDAASPAVVDKAHFDDLTIANPAEHRESAAPLRIGHVSTEALRALGGRGLFEFLLQGKVIRPYVHLGAKFCLVRETNEQDRYEAEFSGYHEYVTDERHQRPLAFVFQVAPDGTMLVRSDAR